MTRFRFVAEHGGPYGAKRVCRVLGVSRSGYYAWRRRPLSERAVRDVELSTLIGEIHRPVQGRASNTMLNGVSVTRRNLVNPALVTTLWILASPAWAPSARPTS